MALPTLIFTTLTKAQGIKQNFTTPDFSKTGRRNTVIRVEMHVCPQTE